MDKIRRTAGIAAWTAPAVIVLSFAGCAATGGQLTVASASGDTGSVMSLLNSGANVNEQAFVPDDPLQCSSGNLTPLMAAACHGQLQIAKLLLDHGADANATNNLGGTALILACAKGHVVIVNLLLDHNADPNMRSSAGWSALMAASENGFTNVAESLLSHNADPNIKSNIGGTPLMAAAYNGHAAIVKLLLKHGADRAVRGDSGRSAAELARMNNHEDIAELIEPGSHPRATAQTATTRSYSAPAAAEPAEDTSTQDIEKALQQLQSQ